MINNRNLINWQKTADLYLNWLKKNELKNYFLENIFYENLSIWWANNLSDKDNVLNNKWFIDLNSYLHQDKVLKFNKFLFFTQFILRFFYNFLKEIIFLIIIKIFFKTRFYKNNKKIMFHAYEYNFIKKGNYYYDKNYSIAPVKNNTNQNIFAINIIKKQNVIKNINFYKNIFKKIKLPYVILDEYLTLKDIINIYLNCLLNFFKSLIFCLNNKNIFFIKKKDCAKIFIPLLLNSFCGTTQQYLLRAKSKYNYLKKNKIFFFICYGEFNPGYLPSYHFVKKANSEILTISIQHAYASGAFLFHNNNKDDFFGTNQRFISPMPDKFFIMGNQYKKILKRYYPKEIKIIGALKYDNFHIKKLRKKKITSTKPIILITPTIGDEDLIIEYLKGVDLTSFQTILSPHPAVFNETVQKFKKKLNNLNFQTYKNLSTNEIISSAKLVVCSSSSTVFESYLLGVSVLRLLNDTQPISFDVNDGISYVTNISDFKKYLLSKKYKKNKIRIRKICKRIYFKLDNKSYKRFWKNLY